MKNEFLKGLAVLGLSAVLLCNVDILGTMALGVDPAQDEQPSVGILSSYPGNLIDRGDSGDAVLDIQRKLNRVAEKYTQIPKLKEDGVFGTATENAVVAFQNQFGLYPDGIVGAATWNKLDQVYEELTGADGTKPDDGHIKKGDKGSAVTKLQKDLNRVAVYYRSIPALEEDGSFGAATEKAVLKFQSLFGLKEDGVVGDAVQQKLAQVIEELDEMERQQKENGNLTEDGHYIADPQRLEAFEFPDDWTKAPLEFAVGNGILNGKGNGLGAGDNATRAETAAILVRLLGAQKLNMDLSAYADVPADAWYYDELSAAVQIELMKGTSETTLSPNDLITREQFMTMLGRAFGLYPTDPDYCDRFADADKISGYARSAVSALAEQGHLNGYADGTVRPQAYINRAEMSKLIYGLFTHICDDPDELPLFGRVLYRGSDELHVGHTLYGDLTIGCGDSGRVYLCDLNVTGTLTIRTSPGASVSLYDNYAAVLSVPAAVELNGNASVDRLMTGGKGSSIGISAEQVYVYGDCVLEKAYTQVNCVAADTVVSVDGTAKNCCIRAERVTLNGLGSAEYVDIYAKEHTVGLNHGGMTDHTVPTDYDQALSTVETVNDWYSFSKGQPYSKDTMEGFVDKMGYSSSTKWLVWVSTKTLTVNVFNGSKGDWTLVRTMPCAMGKPSTPTIKGEFTVYLKDNEWLKNYYNCRWVTYFKGGYAFHSRLWSTDYSYLVDDSMSVLVSEGCVRMYDEDCKYIYDNVPHNSTVVVY